MQIIYISSKSYKKKEEAKDTVFNKVKHKWNTAKQYQTSS
jgi:hypothetical protein